MMTTIRILSNCLASGQPLEAGRVYRVPAEVSQADAEVLLRMGRAVEVDGPAEQAEPETKPRTRRKRNEQAD